MGKSLTPQETGTSPLRQRLEWVRSLEVCISHDFCLTSRYCTDIALYFFCFHVMYVHCLRTCVVMLPNSGGFNASWSCWFTWSMGGGPFHIACPHQFSCNPKRQHQFSCNPVRASI